jgi:hypothetical protein
MDAAIAHERLLASVRNNPDTGCKNRAGRASNRGCGRTMLCDADGSARRERANRASYELFIGPISLDRRVRPRCGNRLCVEPERLELIDPAGARPSPRPL